MLPAPLQEFRLQSHNGVVSNWTFNGCEDVVFDAPYQRQSVWDLDRRRNLIRSLLMGLPVGAVIYSTIPFGAIPDRPNAYRRIIDGKQRLETILAFSANEFGIPGWWLDVGEYDQDAAPGLRERDEVFYRDLSGRQRRSFDSSSLPTLEFNSSTVYEPNPNYVKGADNSSLFLAVTVDDAAAVRREAEVYLLINFGGVEQTDTDRERATSIATPDDPAWIWEAAPTRTENPDGTIEYRNTSGELHRVDGPASIGTDGAERWYINGERHRLDGPAVVRPDGYQAWYRHGLLDRADGPAVVYPDGGEAWYLHGQFHRDNGPAFTFASGRTEWWVDGERRKDLEQKAASDE